MRYFWYHRPEEDFPPPTIQDPDELTDSDRLALACTQTELSDSAQRKLVRAWCELLPTLEGIRLLWLESRVPQKLFDAACAMPDLEGLYVKWSGVKTIDAIEKAGSLRYFHLGSSTSLQSIEPLSRMGNLRWLGLENVKRISSLEALRPLTQLEGLSVEGSIWTTQYVDTLEPIGNLPELRFLALANLRSRDKTLAPLYRLSKLEELLLPQWWDPEEVQEIRRRNPGWKS